MHSGSSVLIMMAWRSAIPRKPGADTDFLGSGHVPTPINLEQPVCHRTPNVVAPTTIQEMSLHKAGESRDIVKPHGSSEGPRGEAVATIGTQRGAARGTRGDVTSKSFPKGFRAHDNMERDSIAASFRFNDVVDELQAELGRGERQLRPLEMVRKWD